jgi:hypothetical protein
VSGNSKRGYTRGRAPETASPLNSPANTERSSGYISVVKGSGISIEGQREGSYNKTYFRP